MSTLRGFVCEMTLNCRLILAGSISPTGGWFEPPPDTWNVLLPVVDRFPKEHIIRYNLACYACQLGNLKQVRDWLKKAIKLANTKDVKLMALNDPDLEPLWKEIGGI
ncbi:MAG: hypothetical protein WCT12_35400 [Verrucomicrobiota bacterium]